MRCRRARGISLQQFEPGTALTFERRGEPTGTPLSSQESSGWPAMTPVVAARVVTPCPPGTDEAAATVAAQQATWEAAAIESYDFTLRYPTDFLFGTYQISVVDGTPVSANASEPGALTDYLDVPELPTTIVEIFEQLERVTADRFDGEFHEQLGYPTHVVVDRIAEAVDDELEFFISDLAVHGGQSAPVSSASEPTGAEQTAVYEVVIRDAFAGWSENDRPDVPGVQLVDHPVADAGQTPLSISASASGTIPSGRTRRDRWPARRSTTARSRQLDGRRPRP